MSPLAAVDLHWSVADLLEHARELATVAGGGILGPEDVRTRAAQVRARCSRLDLMRSDAGRCGRRRDGDRLAQALDRLACAADDLAAIVLLRCGDPAPGGDARTPDLPALLGRVGERHDLVVNLLQRSGIRRMYPAS